VLRYTCCVQNEYRPLWLAFIITFMYVAWVMLCDLQVGYFPYAYVRETDSWRTEMTCCCITEPFVILSQCALRQLCLSCVCHSCYITLHSFAKLFGGVYYGTFANFNGCAVENLNIYSVIAYGIFLTCFWFYFYNVDLHILHCISNLSLIEIMVVELYRLCLPFYVTMYTRCRDNNHSNYVICYMFSKTHMHTTFS